MKAFREILKTIKNAVASLPQAVQFLIHLILLPSFVNTALNLFYFQSNPYDGTKLFGGILLSYLFTCLLYAFLLTLCKRSTIAMSILSLFYFLLGYGNQVKVITSGVNPVFISDLLFITDAETLTDMVTWSDMKAIFISYFWQTILFLFLLSLILFITFTLDYRVHNKKIRYSALASTLLALVMLFVPIKAFQKASYDLFYKAKPHHDPIVYYNQAGFLSGVLGQYWNSNLYNAPDSEAASAILSEREPTTSGDWGTPNVVVIFSESFFDVSKWEDVTYSKDPTSNYTALKEQGISFSSLSPTFGGLSCNAEYQILTGANMSYYPLGVVPYTMHYQKTNTARYHYPSMISDLKNNGYSTTVVSTWAKNLCNCDVVYESMGLDTFIYDYGEEIKGLYYSDRTVGNMIKKSLAEKEAGKPLFYFTQTSEAHMPYYADKFESYDVEILSSPLNNQENAILQSYVQGVYDADAMLADVYAYIQTLSEPTVLLFFGDHLPNLHNYGKSLFDKLEYFNTNNELLNETRKYTTEGLILANFPITDDVDYLSHDVLLPYLFSKTSIALSPYYQYLISTLDTLPALGSFSAYDKNGNLHPLNALPDEMNEIYTKRRTLQASLFFSSEREKCQE